MPTEIELAIARAQQAQKMYRPKDLLERRAEVQSVGLVKEVSRRTVTPKSGAPAFVLYDIEDSNGIKWTTKKDDLALTAHALIGKTATFEGAIRENGRFKDYFLNGIWESNGSAPTTTPGVIPDSTSMIPDSTPTIPAANAPTDKDILIWRQTATKVAAQISEGPVEFWANVEIMMTFYATGQHPEGEGEYATSVTQPRFTGDDDIPF